MNARAISLVVSFFILCVVARAQEPIAPGEPFQTITLADLRSTGEPDAAAALTLNRSDLSRASDGSLAIHNLPALLLIDGRRVADSSFLGSMGLTTADLFPIAFLQAVQVQKEGPSPAYGADATSGVTNLRLNRDRLSSEVGLFYGSSIDGKVRREVEQGYFISGFGNDTTQITVGAFYERSTGRSPRVIGGSPFQ